MSDKLEIAKVHSSLTQKPMVMGLPSDVLMAMGFLSMLFIMAVGMSFIAVGGVIVLLGVAIPVLRVLFAKEPYALELLGKYLMDWKDFMPHHGRVDKSPRPDRVPKNLYA